MKWRPTIPLGRWFGVEIRLDLMVVILIGLLFFSSLSDASTANAPVSEVWTAIAHLVLLVAMLGCMFFHEMAHAIASRMRGHRPTLILLSFVGLTFFEAKRPHPSDEFWIALAGPFANLAVGALCAPFIGLHLAEGKSALFSQQSLATPYGFLAALSILNFAVALGNLTPGWPADGARAVRSWLSRRRGFKKGTERAVQISHGIWLMLAGLSVLILGAGGWFVDEKRPSGQTLALVRMYQFVVLPIAALGLWYGWAEASRVRRLGDQKAQAQIGPPPEFMPRKAKEGEGRTVEAEVVSGGREGDLKQQAKEGAAAAKALWKVAKASGKGFGWFARQGVRAMGAMLGGGKEGDKKEGK